MKKVVIVFLLIASVLCGVFGFKHFKRVYDTLQWQSDFSFVEDEVNFEFGTPKEDKYVQYSITNETDETKTIRPVYQVKDNYYWKIGHIESAETYTIKPGETVQVKVSYSYLSEQIGCNIQTILSVQIERILYE